MNDKRTYKSWSGMRERCRCQTHPKYYRYGGRGIRCCERWNSYANFVADMGERPEGMTLDRVDNNGNYEPSNCRWADQHMQQRNRSTNKLIQTQVDRMRERLIAGEQGQVLALEYGVSEQLVSLIKLGRKWKTSAPREAQSIQGMEA